MQKVEFPDSLFATKGAERVTIMKMAEINTSKTLKYICIY